MQDESRDSLSHISNPIHIIYHIHCPYIKERGEENHHTQSEKNGRIFCHDLLPRTLTRMPDVIKGELYLLHQRDDGIEKHHNTRTDDIIALRVLDIIVNEIHDSLSHNGLRLESGR